MQSSNLRDTARQLLPMLAFLIVILGCANMPERSRQSTDTNSQSSNEPRAKETLSTPVPKWSYSQYEDEMGRGRVHVASIESTNTISLDFPYSGQQHGTLALREHPQHGKDVFLKIERGQMLDSDYNDPVVVRFDSDKPISFSSSGASDHSTETLFLGGNAFAVFSMRLKSAKTVRIQAPNLPRWESGLSLRCWWIHLGKKLMSD